MRHRCTPPPKSPFKRRAGTTVPSSRHPKPSTRTEVANAVAASLRKPCFAEAVDIQPKPQYIAPPYPFRNAKIGFEFEQIGHCLPRLCFAPQMSQGRRKVAISERKKRVLADGLL